VLLTAYGNVPPERAAQLMGMLLGAGVSAGRVDKAGPFLENTAYYAPDAELPINTHGGQLSAGCLDGYGFLREACVQLWREAGDRQIQKDVQIAAVGVGRP